MTSKRSVLELKNISREYISPSGTVTAVSNVNLKIGKHQLTAILGASGSGKSTLLNIMGALDVPTKGELFYNGEQQDITNKKTRTKYRCNEVAFVFQGYNLLPNLSAKDNILAAAEIVKDAKDVNEVLEKVGLLGKENQLPASLSGGEQQRVAIARALIKNAPLILADEPTGALDSNNGLRIMELFRKLVDEEHRSVIIVTHNEELAKMADKIITMKDGRIVSK